MSGIAHYWVEKMFHMAAKLMLATGFREQLDQTIATGGVLLGNRMRQFDLMQATKCRYRLLGRAIRIAHGIGDLVQLLLEGVVDHSLLRGPAPHQRQILLVYLPGGKGLCQDTGDGRIQSKQQHARGWAVETMHGVDMAPP